MIANLHSSQ